MEKINGDVIVFTGGGTGGHVYPNIALMPEFSRRGYNAIYIGGVGDTVERRLAAACGVPYFAIPTVKLVRSLKPKALINDLTIPSKLAKATAAAKDILTDIRPKAVFSKGGFVALPVTLAASKLRIPVFAHESDLTLGLANRIAAIKGATILAANPNSKFKSIFVGMPLRENLFGVERRDAALRLAMPRTTKNVLLVLGGSSGAAYLNEAVVKTLDVLLRDFFVLHVSGKANFVPPVRDGYKCVPYADNIADFYAVSDVVLSRAGATAVYEISALEKRALFVPLPKGISRGDQIFNARLAEEYGGMVLCQNANFCDNLPVALKKTLLSSPMRAICADANGKIADAVCASLRRGVICKDKKL